jgi:UDP-glucose 4-epimerase
VLRLVVTGWACFIGRELKRHARARGIEWVGLDPAAEPATDERRVDIRSPELAASMPVGTDAVVHLAAVSRDQDCRANPSLAFEINVGGTLNVLRAAKQAGTGQVLFASSEWVYGEVGADAVQVEDQPIDATRAQSEYALSKLVGEQLLRLGARDGGPAITVLRFGIVYGPRPANWSAVESLFHAVRTQDTVTVGSRATARRFIHVADIAEGILSAVGQSGFQVFNLSGDRLIGLGEVIEASAAILGRRPEVIEKTPRSVSIRNPDNRKARERLGWRPRLGLREGLRTLWQPEEAACSTS